MLYSLDSHVRPPIPRHNNATERLPGPGRQNAAPLVDLREAYGFARGIARIQPGNAQTRPGHRLVWVRGASFACTTLVAADDAFAVVGRHTQCSVVLPEDPFVALRHVLVRSIALPVRRRRAAHARSPHRHRLRPAGRLDAHVDPRGGPDRGRARRVRARRAAHRVEGRRAPRRDAGARRRHAAPPCAISSRRSPSRCRRIA